MSSHWAQQKWILQIWINRTFRIDSELSLQIINYRSGEPFLGGQQEDGNVFELDTVQQSCAFATFSSVNPLWYLVEVGHRTAQPFIDAQPVLCHTSDGRTLAPTSSVAGAGFAVCFCMTRGWTWYKVGNPKVWRHHLNGMFLSRTSVC
jgi:hypothetical protein